MSSNSPNTQMNSASSSNAPVIPRTSHNSSKDKLNEEIHLTCWELFQDIFYFFRNEPAIKTMLENYLGDIQKRSLRQETSDDRLVAAANHADLLRTLKSYATQKPFLNKSIEQLEGLTRHVVTITTSYGETYSFDCLFRDTIGDVKRRLSHLIGKKNSDGLTIRYMATGKIFKDDEKFFDSDQNPNRPSPEKDTHFTMHIPLESSLPPFTYLSRDGLAAVKKADNFYDLTASFPTKRYGQTTLLQCAARQGAFECFKYLVEDKKMGTTQQSAFNVNDCLREVICGLAETPKEERKAEANYEAIALYLINRGAFLSDDLLQLASQANETDFVETLRQRQSQLRATQVLTELQTHASQFIGIMLYKQECFKDDIGERIDSLQQSNHTTETLWPKIQELCNELLDKIQENQPFYATIENEYNKSITHHTEGTYSKAVDALEKCLKTIEDEIATTTQTESKGKQRIYGVNASSSSSPNLFGLPENVSSSSSSADTTQQITVSVETLREIKNIASTAQAAFSAIKENRTATGVEKLLDATMSKLVTELRKLYENARNGPQNSLLLTKATLDSIQEKMKEAKTYFCALNTSGYNIAEMRRHKQYKEQMDKLTKSIEKSIARNFHTFTANTTNSSCVHGHR